MFWRLGFAQSSPIETLLDSDNFTLQQLLDEDDLVQECKQINNKLLDFLSLPEQVEAMVTYIVDEPPEDASDKLKLVYPYKSSEVLASDVGSIHDCLLQHSELLDKLFGILDKAEGELHFMRAGFFSKVMTAMINYRPEDTLTALKERGGLELLLRHINTYSVLELLLKVVQEAEEAGGGGISWCAWLMDQDLVAQLLGRLDQSESEQVHENVCGALVWMVSQHGQMQWVSTPTLRDAPLAKRLLEPQVVSLLVDKCLAAGKPSALEHGIGVVLEIAKVAARDLYKDPASEAAIPKTPDPSDPHQCPSDFLANLSSTEGAGDTEADRKRREVAVGQGTTIGMLLERLGELVALLHRPPAMAAIVNSTGRLDPPLGVTRLRVVELLGMLVALDNSVVEQRLAATKALPAVLDMFFKYEWHNLLHNNVVKIAEPIILSQSASTEVLQKSLLDEGQLLPRIIRAHADNDEHVKRPKAARKGYMGHLRLISIAIVKAAKSDSFVKTQADTPEWKLFLKAHQEITDDMSNDVNDSKSQPPASPAHNLSSLSQQGDDLEELEDLEPVSPEPAHLVASESPSRDSPPQKELPPTPPSTTPPKPAPPMTQGGPCADGAATTSEVPTVDALARVVASVTLDLRMHEGSPVASAQVSLKVA